jgi:hypothetical protein
MKEATEDDLFKDAVMLDALNGAHKAFAALARPYMAEITVNLAASTVMVALPDTVIEVDQSSVRVRAGTGALDTSGAWTRLTFKQRRSLIGENGAPEAWTALATAPTNFFVMPGATNDAIRKIGVYPPATTGFLGSPVGTNNLRMDAWVYPSDLALADASLPLSDHEQWRLVPWICKQMAQLERSRGRPDAPVEMWERDADKVALELRDIIRRGMEEIQRSANVGESALQDAQDRRLLPGARRSGG